MGGNALKNCETRRVSAEEYYELAGEVQELLLEVSRGSPRGIGYRVDVVLSYGNKPDFGDIDVLFETSDRVAYDNLPKQIGDAFNSKEVVSNGTCISAEYKSVQVDVIKTPSHEHYPTFIYFAYNDLGNLMGRIALRMGFKYGHRGLLYEFRTHDDHVFEKVLVSGDHPRIFEFLGYSFDVWLKGFSEVEDIFEFVVSSPYFNKNVYLLENKNSVSRTRDKKRKTYNLFLKWVEDKTGMPEYPWPSFDERGIRKSSEEFLERAFSIFPRFLSDFQVAQKRLQNYEKFKTLFKTLFSGERVRVITGLDGIELGNFIKRLKHWGDQCNHGSLQNYILHLESQDKVDAFIKDSFELQQGFKI